MAMSALFFQRLEAQASEQTETLRIMSFNLWHGGDGGRQPLSQTAKVITEAKAEVVGLQEISGFSQQGEARPDRSLELARLLGWNHLRLNSGALISKYTMVPQHSLVWGAKLRLPSGKQVYIFNVHLAHAPYQPYQLYQIEYAGAPFLTTEIEAVQAAKNARGEQVKHLLNEVKVILSEGLPVFLTGDFNEPSHQDWTSAAVACGYCRLAVEWPSTKALVDAGFWDAYRLVYPDPVKNRGLTWTPTTSVMDSKDRHDRIDYIFVYGVINKVLSASIIGESKENADIVVSPYPSDHRAIVAEVELQNDAQID